MSQYRICFAGTPGFAAGHLAALIDSPHQLCGVFTQPDRPTGRGKKLQASAVKELALAHGLPVYQPPSLRDPQAQSQLQALQPDVLVVVAYGLLLPQAILDIPRYGCLNVHASLLPRWRGAAPIERALLAGDDRTGITVMQMQAGLDSGPMLLQESVPIDSGDTRESLEQKLLEVGKRSLLEVLEDLARYQQQARPQDDALSTYANKLDKQESLIDWHQPAVQVDRLVRAGVGRLPAYSYFAGERLRILDGKVLSESAGQPGTIVAASRDAFVVACGSGGFQVSQVQQPGKKPLAVREISNARPDFFAPGQTFADAETAGA